MPWEGILTIIILPLLGLAVVIVAWFLKRMIAKNDEALQILSSDLVRRMEMLESKIESEIGMLQESWNERAARTEAVIEKIRAATDDMKDRVNEMALKMERSCFGLDAVNEQLERATVSMVGLTQDIKDAHKGQAATDAKVRVIEEQVERLGRVIWIRDDKPRRR